MPIPLVPDGPVWRWDTRAGQEEILTRRIGRNELYTIQTCLAYVDAQREYYAAPRGDDGVLQYAQRFASTPGKRDGLYWATTEGETPSPLGLLAARARAEGYSGKSEGPDPLSRLLLPNPHRAGTVRARRAATTTWPAAA